MDSSIYAIVCQGMFFILYDKPTYPLHDGAKLFKVKSLTLKEAADVPMETLLGQLGGVWYQKLT